VQFPALQFPVAQTEVAQHVAQLQFTPASEPTVTAHQFPASVIQRAAPVPCPIDFIEMVVTPWFSGISIDAIGYVFAAEEEEAFPRRTDHVPRRDFQRLPSVASSKVSSNSSENLFLVPEELIPKIPIILLYR
jgi:hypothetical protein